MQKIRRDLKRADGFLATIVLKLFVALIHRRFGMTAGWFFCWLDFLRTGFRRKDVAVISPIQAAEMRKHIDPDGTCKQQEHKEEQNGFSQKRLHGNKDKLFFNQLPVDFQDFVGISKCCFELIDRANTELIV